MREGGQKYIDKEAHKQDRQKQTGREWTVCHFQTSMLRRLCVGRVNLPAVSRQLFNSTPKCWCLPLSLSGFPRWWFECMEGARGALKGKGEWRWVYEDETDSTLGVKKICDFHFFSICAPFFFPKVPMNLFLLEQAVCVTSTVKSENSKKVKQKAFNVH